MDHRDLNQDLPIYATDPLVGAGLPLWLPDGAVIRAELERLATELARADGCLPVATPVLAKRALFERSGHWAKFHTEMFPPIRVGGEDLVLRPANCPHHAMVYAAARRSYRELPLRLHEIAAMFRAERSGSLAGLSRVRQINLDDTHVFARPDQVGAEAARALASALRAQRILDLPVDHVRLSLRDQGADYLGATEQWVRAEAALRAAAAGVAESGLPVLEAPGEAAFYGPKLDLQVVNARGQEETIATVQVDFVQPERFDLRYDAADGSRPRPVLIHRGTVGSMERVTAAVLERTEGRLPLWLAPVQVAVLPVGPDQDRAAGQLHSELIGAGLRARLLAEGSLGARVRASRIRRDAVIAVLGASEVAAAEVAITEPASGFRGAVARDALVARLTQAHRDRVPPVW